MKFQNMIRVQVMLMGLGAGLLLAKPVFAQQDTDPTLFEAAPDATQLDQARLNIAAPPPAATKVTADSTAASPVQEADLARLTEMDQGTIAFLVVGIGSFVLLGMAEAARGSRGRTWRERASGDFLARATAN